MSRWSVPLLSPKRFLIYGCRYTHFFVAGNDVIQIMNSRTLCQKCFLNALVFAHLNNTTLTVPLGLWERTQLGRHHLSSGRDDRRVGDINSPELNENITSSRLMHNARRKGEYFRLCVSKRAMDSTSVIVRNGCGGVTDGWSAVPSAVSLSQSHYIASFLYSIKLKRFILFRLQHWRLKV